MAAKRMRAAYHAESPVEAESLLTAPARELDKTHACAVASLREGLDETLTVLRLDVPPTLARTLGSTDENVNGVADNSRSLVQSWPPTVAA